MREYVLSPSTSATFSAYPCISFVICSDSSAGQVSTAYYNYYTQNRWGDAHNYDLAINAALGRETCVKMILDAAAAKEKNLG